jgi:hypothetical protein
VCIDKPLSLSSQITSDMRAAACPVRCVSEQGFGFPHADVRCAARQRKKLEHPYKLLRSVLDAVAGLGAARRGSGARWHAVPMHELVH